MAAFVVNTTLIYKFLHVHIITILLWLMLDIGPNFKFRKKHYSHWIQGQTIKKPNKLIVNLQRVFEAAQSYVMLSRVESLNQLIIINDVCSEKIYSSKLALMELERLKELHGRFSGFVRQPLHNEHKHQICTKAFPGPN